MSVSVWLVSEFDSNYVPTKCIALDNFFEMFNVINRRAKTESYEVLFRSFSHIINQTYSESADSSRRLPATFGLERRDLN